MALGMERTSEIRVRFRPFNLGETPIVKGIHMRTTYRNNARGGHCPGHVRDTFISALEAYEAWEDGKPEPTVEFEVDHEPRSITISQAAGLVWNCSDILPGSARFIIESTGLDALVKRWTYASAARAMATEISRA